ncbi:cobalamin biosynthesis protein CbiX [Cellulomonas sp. WB94]|uniref:sirohydrochlorin chelatase n=1 Tax=Cellulomonas sp. WB94 TaxID=2173174 RepID=UPI000D57ED22|nr:CbiX/SirB N-terminal domain-containing protein [Cellulomonas sp. WB94]PVU82149.1 cobalamin biosynthesis protein CbiX [Cellulomonas sp. WB94]
MSPRDREAATVERDADVATARAVLVGCSHGTDNLEGRAVIRSILASVADARPDLVVREAFVDVQEPAVADVVASAAELGLTAVVVPLLLSVGFHVRVDIAAAVEDRLAIAAPPLGPDPRLVDVLVDRLTQAGLAPGDSVVLAAAGSTDPAAAVAVEEVAAGLATRLGRPVTVGYGAGSTPRVPEAVAAARATAPGRVVVASYLLAPGFFHDRVLDAGADVVSAPLAPDDRIVEIVLDRYASAAAVLEGSGAQT